MGSKTEWDQVLPVEAVSLGKLLEMLFLADGHITPSTLAGAVLQATRGPALKSICWVGFIPGGHPWRSATSAGSHRSTRRAKTFVIAEPTMTVKIT